MGLFSKPILGNGGIFGGLTGDQGGPDGDARQAMMAQLLQGGGYSPQRQSFGQIMGQALMAGQAARQQSIKLQQARDAADMDKKYQQAQIDHLNRPANDLGSYQPGDYTPDSWAAFINGGQKDPSVLVRYEAPRQQTSKPFQHVMRTLPDGSTEMGVMDSRSGEYSWSGVIVPPGVKARVDAQGTAEGAGAGNIATDIQKKGSSATTVKGLLSDARALLQSEDTTGSAGGAAMDAVAGVVGHSTAGAKATARLKVIQGGLVANMPRMEGPQSDADRLLYQQAAGQLADSTTPTETRLAALDTIEEIQGRYQERAATAPHPASANAPTVPGAAPKKKRYNPATGRIE